VGIRSRAHLHHLAYLLRCLVVGSRRSPHESSNIRGVPVCRVLAWSYPIGMALSPPHARCKCHDTVPERDNPAVPSFPTDSCVGACLGSCCPRVVACPRHSGNRLTCVPVRRGRELAQITHLGRQKVSTEKLVEVLGKRIGRRNVVVKTAVGTVGALLAIMGLPQLAAAYSVYCCSLCNPSNGTSCPNGCNVCAWCWSCLWTDGFYYSCCECHSSGSCGSRTCTGACASYAVRLGQAPIRRAFAG